MFEETKRCPFCAETIQRAAIVCKHCGRDLPIGPRIERKELGYACSECGEFIRPDSEKCKHCGAQFVGKPLPTSVQVIPAKKPSFAAYALVTLVLLGACAWFFWPTGGGSRGAPSSTAHMIQYQVQGTARGASLTYQNEGGDTEQKDVSLPWAQSFSMREGQFVYVSAQNKGETGTIICNILLDGVVVKTSKSEGAYKIASCSGKI